MMSAKEPSKKPSRKVVHLGGGTDALLKRWANHDKLLNSKTDEERVRHALHLNTAVLERLQRAQEEMDQKEAAELAEFLGESGGRQEARTPDLRVANAALSQLS